MDTDVIKTIWGCNPQIIAAGILLFAYIILFTEKVNRAVVAIIGAAVMTITGIISQEEAFKSIDFNTLSLLIGMMTVVGISGKSGLFQYIAIYSAKLVKANPRLILVIFCLVTAFLSAVFDNVTTVLLIIPITILITEKLNISPYPFFYTEIAASNIGGTATLVGDPPNILIGSARNLSFADFLINMLPISVIALFILIIATDLIFGRKLHAEEKNRRAVMRMNEKDQITDISLLKKSLFIVSLVIIGFLTAERIGLENGTVAMLGAALLIFMRGFGEDNETKSKQAEKAFTYVDWVTIFFFAGLFVIVGGVEHTKLLEVLAKKIIEVTDGNIYLTTVAVLWLSALVSSFLDNIPFVATMIPLLKSIENTVGECQVLWWALAIGACLGGNGTLIGASANVMVAGMAERNGKPITFLGYMLYGIPVMLCSIILAHLYIVLRYF